MLETKLAVLQRLVGQTGTSSEEAWKSLIDEDRLLTRVEILESQLSTYGKAMTEDKLREETQRLMEEKELYQETAKETLKKLVDEKLEAVKKQKDLEKALSNTEDEYSSLKELYEKYVDENRELALQVNSLTNELEELKKLSANTNGKYIEIRRVGENAGWSRGIYFDKGVTCVFLYLYAAISMVVCFTNCRRR